jgi:hypothetical protein
MEAEIRTYLGGESAAGAVLGRLEWSKLRQIYKEIRQHQLEDKILTLIT